MPTFRVNTKQKGVIFSASKTKAAANRLVIRINEFIAEEGVQRVKDYLNRVLQNPTGYYESRIRVERRAIFRGVTDGGVVYGGWLEGVDPRNRTTRFKGYRTFRTVKQQLDRDAEALARPLVSEFVREMNS